MERIGFFGGVCMKNNLRKIKRLLKKQKKKEDRSHHSCKDLRKERINERQAKTEI